MSLSYQNNLSTVYIKLAFTSKCNTYYIDPDMSVDQFIRNMVQIVKADTNIYDLNENDLIEFVDVNQTHIDGQKAEEAPALESLNISVRDHFKNNNIALYVRRVN